MIRTSEIVAEYGITESRLKEYIIEQNIPLVNEEEIAKKYFQTILSFIETTEDRIEKKLKKAEATFKYNSDKYKVSIYQDDAISFLKKLPSNSVDIIATDPAYSGMNDKLKLGKGRIVGNLGKDPEKIELENNLVVTKFTLATSEVYKDDKGVEHANTEWHSIVVWGNLATLAANYLKKAV